ncbi:ATP-binding protein [Sphingomonas sp. BT-65]|uniref:ATP-binding protein n=1 Tax=Sphingomonas sp. BT-65 TaxID=2989821 RepID=UPI002235C349|nr:ATP-binding protein [Sphingomonas sp. BT-65]MCW4462669.1 ATP-binding protein [Sphingomonas sp. BT-65]
MSNMGAGFRPATTDDWMALRAEVLELFTPGAPIDEVTLFAGRQSQIQKLRDTLVSKGRHAVVFGEKGVGKTSIVSIFHLGVTRTSRVHRIYVQCSKRDEYKDIWIKAFKRIKFIIDGNEIFGDLVNSNPQSPDDVEMVLSYFGQNDIPVIIFDEFDRVVSEDAKALMSETIKHLSNAPIPGIIILVGVAGSVPQLISHHHSISRTLVQVEMPRMTVDELRELVTSRLQRTPLKISDDALWRITHLASGLPFYAHALGQAAALVAVEGKTLNITESTVEKAIPRCFADLDQSLIDAYVKATVETRKGNIFKQVLAACALAEQDDLGRFAAADVETTLTEIMGREMKAPAFSFHLNDLCTSERGLILEKTGTRSHFRFRFREPMMQPFVIIKSLSTEVIDLDQLQRFGPSRQRSLGI